MCIGTSPFLAVALELEGLPGVVPSLSGGRQSSDSRVLKSFPTGVVALIIVDLRDESAQGGLFPCYIILIKLKFVHILLRNFTH